MYDSYNDDLRELQVMRAELEEFREQLQHGFKMLDAMESMFAAKYNQLDGMFLRGVHRERKSHLPYSKRKMRSMFL